MAAQQGDALDRGPFNQPVKGQDEHGHEGEQRVRRGRAGLHDLLLGRLFGSPDGVDGVLQHPADQRGGNRWAECHGVGLELLQTILRFPHL